MDGHGPPRTHPPRLLPRLDLAAPDHPVSAPPAPPARLDRGSSAPPQEVVTDASDEPTQEGRRMFLPFLEEAARMQRVGVKKKWHGNTDHCDLTCDRDITTSDAHDEDVRLGYGGDDDVDDSGDGDEADADADVDGSDGNTERDRDVGCGSTPSRSPRPHPEGNDGSRGWEDERGKAATEERTGGAARGRRQPRQTSIEHPAYRGVQNGGWDGGDGGGRELHPHGTTNNTPPP